MSKEEANDSFLANYKFEKIIIIIAAIVILLLLIAGIFLVSSKSSDLSDYDMSEISFNSQEVEYNGSEQSLEIEGDLPDGVSVSYTYDGEDLSGETDAGEYTVVASFTGDTSEYNEIDDMTATLTIDQVSLEDYFSLSNQTVVYDGNEHNIELDGILSDTESVTYTYNNTVTSGEINVGSYYVVAEITSSSDNFTDTLATLSATLTIEQAQLTVSNVSLSDSTVTYDGETHSLDLVGSLNDDESVTYTYNGKEVDGVSEAGEYSVVAIISTTDTNYLEASLSATLTIEQASINVSDLSLSNSIVTYDGETHSINLVGSLNDDESVSYTYNGEEVDGVSEAGTYVVVASVTTTDTNYKVTTLEATLTIEQASLNLTSVVFDDSSVTYDGNTHSIELVGTLSEYESVTYTYNGDSVSGVSEAGTYVVVASVTTTDTNYKTTALSATLTIKQAVLDLSSITLGDSSVTYDGETHSIEIEGDLPSVASVSYTYDSEDITSETDAGTYAVVATITVNSNNYSNTTTTLSATLTIKQAVLDLSGITLGDSSVTYDGESHSIEIEGDLPSVASVSYTYNSEDVTSEIDAGTYAVVATITVNSNNYSNTTTTLSASLTIEQASIDLSEIYFTNTTTTYTGESQNIELVGDLASTVSVSYIYTLNGSTVDSPTDAGEYKVTAVFISTDSNYATTTVTTTFTIEEASIDLTDVTFDEETVTYDEKSHTIEVVGDLPDTVSVSYIYSCDGSTVDSAIDAGEYTVVAVFISSDSNYITTTLSTTLTIEKSSIDLTGVVFEDSSVTYDGNSHSLAIEGDLDSSVSVGYTYTYDGVETDSVVNAGTYTVVATFTSTNSNYLTTTLSAKLIIDQALIDLTGVTLNGDTVTYDGCEHSLAIEGTLSSDVDVTYTYTYDGSETDSVVNVGTYTVVATFTTSDSNYATTILSTTLTIEQASIDLTGITLSSDTVTYDGNSHSLAIEGTLSSDVEVTYTYEYDGSVVDSVVNAGTYTVVATFTSTNSNYATTTLTKTLIIEQESIDLTGITLSNGTVTYDGNSHSLAIEGTLSSDVEVTYTYEYDGSVTDSVVNAGTYTVVATFTSTDTNYSSTTLTATLTIKQAVLDLSDITLGDASYTYDGESHSLAIEGTLPSVASVSYTYEYDGSVTDSVIDAGEYTVIATITISSNNYSNTTTTLSATLTIDKASINLTGITLSNDAVTYDGNSHSLAIEGTLSSDVEVTYTYEYGGSVTDSVVNAGIYTVVATFTSTNSNYATATLTAKLTIEQADMDLSGITLGDSTVTYDGESHNIEIAGDIPDGISVIYTYNGTTSDGKTEVGEYTVIAIISVSSSNYTDKTITLTATLTIVAKSIDLTGITFGGATVEYDGETHSLAIEGTLPSGVTVTYTYNSEDVDGVSASGEYTVVATFTSTDSNYATATLTATLIIEQETIDLSGVTFKDSTVTYDGESHSIAIVGDLDSDVSVSYTYEYDGATVDSAVDAGEYIVIATFTSSESNYTTTLSATLTIEQAVLDLSDITLGDASYTYDGENHSIAIVGDLPSVASVSYTYNGNSVSGVSEAGEYIVIAIITVSSSNYSNTSTTLTAALTIDQAELTLSGITLSDSKITYDGNSHSLEIEGTLPDDVSVVYTYEYEGSVTDSVVNVGEYTVVATFTSTDTNYSSTTLTATLTIKQAELTLSGITLSDSNVTYDGNSHSIAIEGTLSDDVDVSYTYTYEGSVTDSVVDAGEYTVIATFTSTNSNYASTTLSATLTIKQAELTLSGITLSDSNVTYDGNSHSIAIEGTLPDDVSVVYKYEYEGSVTDSVVNAGEYTVIATFTSTDSNYASTTLSATLTIKQAELTLSGITLSDSNVTYDGNSHSIAIEGTLPDDVSVVYKYEYEGSVTDSVVNAGEYTVVATFTSTDSNYASTTLSATLTIKQAELTLSGITLSDSKVTYDGNSHSIAIEGTLPDDVSVSYTYEYDGSVTDSVVNAGEYTVVATFTSTDSNYSSTTLTATLTIKQASIELTGVTFSDETVEYDGYTHSITLNNISSDLTVSYTYNEQSVTEVSDVGTYTVVAIITSTDTNYSSTTLTATLTITGLTDYSYQITRDGVILYCYSGSDTEVTTPKKVSINGTIYSVIGIGEHCFEENRDSEVKITSVVISEGVISIGDCCFQGCSLLSSVTLPDSLIFIGNYAFYNCKSLSSITIPENVSYIGTYCFYLDSALTNIYFDDTDSWSVSNNINKWNRIGVSNSYQNSSYFENIYDDCYWQKN